MVTILFLTVNVVLFLIILHYLRQLIEITHRINIEVLPTILPALYNKDYSSSSTDTDTDSFFPNPIPTGSYTVTIPTTNWNNNFSVPQTHSINTPRTSSVD